MELYKTSLMRVYGTLQNQLNEKRDSLTTISFLFLIYIKTPKIYILVNEFFVTFLYLQFRLCFYLHQFYHTYVPDKLHQNTILPKQYESV